MRLKRMNKKADLPEYFVEFFSIFTFFVFVFVFTVVFLNMKSCTSGASTNTISSVNNQNNLYRLGNLELLNYRIKVNNSVFGTYKNTVSNYPLKTAIPIFLSQCNRFFQGNCNKANPDICSCLRTAIINTTKDNYDYNFFVSGDLQLLTITELDKRCITKSDSQKNACYYLYRNISNAFAQFYLIKKIGWLDAYGIKSCDGAKIKNALINVSFGDFKIFLIKNTPGAPIDNRGKGVYDPSPILVKMQEKVCFSEIIPLTILKNNQKINYTFTMRN